MPVTNSWKTPENAATFVWYEYDVMFCGLARMLHSRVLQMLFSQIIFNSLLESFLIHTRNICDFLYNKKKTDDDIVARSYNGRWEKSMRDHEKHKGDQPKCDLCSDCPYIAKHYSRINKAVTHLSYERILYEINEIKGEKVEEEKRKGWRDDTIFSELGTVWDEFWNQLAEDERSWFKKDRSEVMAKIIEMTSD